MSKRKNCDNCPILELREIQDMLEQDLEKIRRNGRKIDLQEVEARKDAFLEQMSIWDVDCSHQCESFAKRKEQEMDKFRDFYLDLIKHIGKLKNRKRRVKNERRGNAA